MLDPLDGSLLIDIGPDDAGSDNYGLTGLTFNRDSGLFYGATSPTDPNYLVSINLLKGHVHAIGPLGTRITDIAFDPESGIHVPFRAATIAFTG